MSENSKGNDLVLTNSEEDIIKEMRRLCKSNRPHMLIVRVVPPGIVQLFETVPITGTRKRKES